MTISVVMPTLNEERVLPVTLPRAAATLVDEVIVVDGGSHDRTTEIVTDCCTSYRSLPRITLLTAPAGRARQMNAGAAVAQGEVLLFLHADTRLPGDARQAIEQALEDPMCVGGRFDVRFEQDSGLGRLVARLMNLRSRWTGIATGDQAVFVRRRVFEELGGFSDIPIMEDVEFTSRLKRAGQVAALRSQVVTSYRRWSTRGAGRTIVLMWALRFLYWLGVSPQKLSHLYGIVR